MDPLHIPIGTAIAILGLAFGAWAWVVMWGVGVVRREISELKLELREERSQARKERVETEGRLSHLETVANLCAAGAKNHE